MTKAAILEKLETINQASGALEDLELVAALAKTVLGRIADPRSANTRKRFLLVMTGKRKCVFTLAHL